MPWITVNTEEPKPTTFEDLGYVQVVRCKDCKHHGEGTCSAEAGIAFPPPDDWYCADGERKEGDGDV